MELFQSRCSLVRLVLLSPWMQKVDRPCSRETSEEDFPKWPNNRAKEIQSQLTEATHIFSVLVRFTLIETCPEARSEGHLIYRKAVQPTATQSTCESNSLSDK